MVRAPQRKDSTLGAQDIALGMLQQAVPSREVTVIHNQDVLTHTQPLKAPGKIRGEDDRRDTVAEWQTPLLVAPRCFDMTDRRIVNCLTTRFWAGLLLNISRSFLMWSWMASVAA